MSTSSADRNPVESLAEEFAERYRNGERPALSEYTDKYPELADEIRDLFPALVMMENLKPAAGDITGGFEPVRESKRLERLGDYRILREVGRGGMGIVYEAEQISLGRHVALKVLPSHALLDPKQVQRFEREAKAAARLHHTNIVPVYGVGEADGLHYYVMQFIQGQALDQVLRELKSLRGHGTLTAPLNSASVVAQVLLTGIGSTRDDTGLSLDEANSRQVEAPKATRSTDTSSTIRLPGQSSPSSLASSGQEYWRSVARIGVQVADALAYASSQGTLHRDIKPSNLILDTQATVWITDFGLAKAADSADLTHPGDFVGTLRYMAPERFGGQADIRSDVYALGLTLYELATLQPAFTANDKHKLMQQVMHEEPQRPRKLAVELPRDLETIILKSIARDQEQRYQTPTRMAEDLRRYLEDRPIQARRTSNFERAWRWARRNPVVAGLSAIAFALLAVIAVGGVVMSIRLDHALDDTGRALEQAEKDRDKAEAAEKERIEQLWQSRVDRAGAEVNSRRVGQRIKTLAAIQEAAAIKVTPKLKEIAAAALLLPDFELLSQWEGWREDTGDIAFDVHFKKFVRVDRAGNFEIGQVTDTGEEILQRLPSTDGPPMSPLWLSPNGRFLAYGLQRGSYDERKLFCVRDLEAAGMPFIIKDGAGQWFDAIAFQRQGHELAVGHADGSVSRYSLPDGQRVKRWPVAAPGKLRHLAYDAVGDRLAACTVSDVQIFELLTAKRITAFTLLSDEGSGVSHEGWMVTWRPDGRAIAVGDHRRIRLFDPGTGKERMRAWDEHTTAGIQCYFLSQGDRLLSTTWHGQVQLWDAHAGLSVLTLPEELYMRAHDANEESVIVTRVGSKLRRWRVWSGSELRLVDHPWGGSDRNLQVATPDPSGRLLAINVTAPNGLCFVDTRSGEAVGYSPYPGNENHALNRIETPRGWVTAAPNGFALWPLEKLNDGSRWRIGPPSNYLDIQSNSDLHASRDGKVIALPDHTGAIILHGSPPTIRLRTGPQPYVRSVGVSPDGTLVATSTWQSDGKLPMVQIWDAITGKLVKALDLPQDGSDAWFSPDGRWLATASMNVNNAIWEVGTWRKVRQFSYGYGMAFSPDGKLVALGDEPGMIRLVETETNREVARIPGPHPGRYEIGVFLDDGCRLSFRFAIGRGKVCILDLRAIRVQLKALALDWEWPEFGPESPPMGPIRVEIVPGKLPMAVSRSAPEQMVAAYSLAIALQPINPEAYFRRGKTLDQLKRHREAIEDFDRALSLRPRHLETFHWRGHAYEGLKDWKRADADFSVCLAQKSEDAHFLDCRGRCRLQLSQFDGAVADLERSLTIQPDQKKLTAFLADACNTYAWRLLMAPAKEREAAQALRFAQKAVDRKPDEANYLNTLGVAQYRTGAYKDAVVTLNKSLALGKGQADAHDLYFLAMCHAKLGDESKANDHFERADLWAEAHKNLAPALVGELTAFRAEAETILKETRPGKK